jgi:pyrroline-5-carboxylate reductase
MAQSDRLAILGTGNIGSALAHGLVRAALYAPENILLTRRREAPLADFAHAGYSVGTDNRKALADASVIVLAVQPQQLDELLEGIAPAVDPARHVIISVVSGARCADIAARLGGQPCVVRAMPNVAIAIGQSMTCIAGGSEAARAVAVRVFDAVGTTMAIDEEQMVPATALCACGIAFFLRAVRAAAQGGIEIGFHPKEAIAMAAQTALGAAALTLESGNHPEHEIDTVTTPRGCTIAGLNELEHRGLSSAMIKGILTAAEKAATLYTSD